MSQKVNARDAIFQLNDRIVKQKNYITFLQQQLDEKNIEYPIIDRQYIIDNDLKRKIWYNRDDMARFANESFIIMRLLKSGYNVDEELLSNTLFPKQMERIDESVYPDEAS